jgi:hypothetical protein
MAAFLLRVKRKSTLLLLIVKRRVREASGLLQRLVRKQQPCAIRRLPMCGRARFTSWKRSTGERDRRRARPCRYKGSFAK